MKNILVTLGTVLFSVAAAASEEPVTNRCEIFNDSIEANNNEIPQVNFDGSCTYEYPRLYFGEWYNISAADDKVGAMGFCTVLNKSYVSHKSEKSVTQAYGYTSTDTVIEIGNSGAFRSLVEENFNEKGEVEEIKIYSEIVCK